MVEAVTQGDVDTAKRLLRVAESGKQLFMFVLTATYTTLSTLYSVILVGAVQMGTVQVMQVLTYTNYTNPKKVRHTQKCINFTVSSGLKE